jgi:hypothetical protein
MANTLTNTLYTSLARVALEAFVTEITPLMAFSTNFSADTVERGDKVKVLFVDAATAALVFTDPGTYTVQDSTAQGLDITINQRRYVSWHLTTEQMATNPQVVLERFARQKGFALAKAVLQDIWGLVTLANYGAAIFSGLPTTFNNDDVADMEATLDDALWPMSERSLILKPAYKAALVKDVAIASDLGVDNSPLVQESRIQRIHGFNLYKSALVPANAENLIGMAAHPDGILVAMRVLQPEPNDVLNFFEVLTDEKTGITLTLREWFDPITDRTIRVLECNYGRRPGNTGGIKRLTSA